MRNPNGYGSVYKLSGNRRRPYAARITTGFKDNGQPEYKFLGYFECKQDAMICLAEYNKNPYDVDMRKYTIADMWQLFSERSLYTGSKSKTNVYKSAYKHLSPLYDAEISRLKTYQMQTLLDGLSLGHQAKSHIKGLLLQMFNIAAELDICEKNYASFLKAGEKEVSTIHSAFTPEEIKTLWDNVFTQKSAMYALILIYTGMRPTELLELKTENIFLADKYMVGGIKTKAGKNRIIPINDKILPLIKSLYNPDNVYLINHISSYVTFSKKWKNEMCQMGMSHLPHDGRHTFASLMDTAGANKLATKRIMGHATQDITDQVYTHKATDELLKNVNLI